MTPPSEPMPRRTWPVRAASLGPDSRRRWYQAGCSTGRKPRPGRGRPDRLVTLAALEATKLLEREEQQTASTSTVLTDRINAEADHDLADSRTNAHANRHTTTTSAGW